MNSETNISVKDAQSEANRRGLICIIILIVGCLGGINVGYRAV